VVVAAAAAAAVVVAAAAVAASESAGSQRGGGPCSSTTVASRPAHWRRDRRRCPVFSADVGCLYAGRFRDPPLARDGLRVYRAAVTSYAASLARPISFRYFVRARPLGLVSTVQ
jgi:hypothetical protein